MSTRIKSLNSGDSFFDNKESSRVTDSGFSDIDGHTDISGSEE